MPLLHLINIIVSNKLSDIRALWGRIMISMVRLAVFLLFQLKITVTLTRYPQQQCTCREHVLDYIWPIMSPCYQQGQGQGQGLCSQGQGQGLTSLDCSFDNVS